MFWPNMAFTETHLMTVGSKTFRISQSRNTIMFDAPRGTFHFNPDIASSHFGRALAYMNKLDRLNYENGTMIDHLRIHMYNCILF